MCGIVGIISNKIPIKPEMLISMRDTLIHRGPDDCGIWINKSGFVGFGHRRLSIIDLSEAGRQPMQSSDGRFVITFNGEIYNFQEIREELKQKYSFKSRTDAEVLLYSYVEWGKNCLYKLRGMFAFAMWDDKEKKLFAARDRAGEKPFYYYLRNGEFVFASELKAITLYEGFEKRIDYRSLIDYLTFGYITAPKSIWKDCYKLPAGHYLQYSPDDGKLNIKCYWDIDLTPDYSKSESFWIEGIREHLKESVNLMLTSDVPLGAFLSGGVDSSAVVSVMKGYKHDLKTFSVGFENGGSFNELPYAINISTKIGTEHKSIYVKENDFIELFDKMSWFYDEPFGDHSYLPTFCVSRLARKEVTVAISGDGGDELFGGYIKYWKLPKRERIRKLMSVCLVELIEKTVGGLLDKHSRIKRGLNYLKQDENNSIIVTSGGHRFENLKGMISNKEFEETLKDYNPFNSLTKFFNNDKVKNLDIVTKARYLDFKWYLCDDILTKVDRASMAISLEVRAPLLDYKFIDFISHIPNKFLINRSSGKKIFKKALEGIVPQENLYRNKQGFEIPLAKWFKGKLHGFLNNDYISEHPINNNYAKNLKISFIKGNNCLAYDLHLFLFLDNWLRRWG
ncbi:MAG: asparagine synthase (glutamine-hydrolyzing) [Candidatus Edwardsbacteria bacterium]